MSIKHISIFASGSGSNALNIIRHFKKSKTHIYQFTIFCNNPNAGILQTGRAAGAELILFNKKDFKEGVVLKWLLKRKTQLIVLAGFLWLIPSELVQAYAGKIINIHPSLLPKYGGKGMFGAHVHKAVLANGDKKSGITIHQVNEYYDQGQVIFQACCNVVPEDTPKTLQRKVQALEHRYFPLIIEELLEETR